jgi:hypothetical protein
VSGRKAAAATASAIVLDPDHPHSEEEARMRVAIADWGQRRWPGYRCIHEVPLSERRIDMVFVGAKDLVGIEIKSSRDRLDRLDGQIEEYSRWLPEVWIAVAAKWENHGSLQHGRCNLIIVDDSAQASGVVEHRQGLRPYRDELVCSRMLGLLWREEAARIAQRTGVIPGTSPTKDPRHKILPMLARLLTGNEIMREVCAELRQRSAFGWQSDEPMERDEEPEPMRQFTHATRVRSAISP